MPRGLPEDLYLRFCSGAYRRQRARGSPLPAGRRVFIEDFRQDYNAERPHSSLGYLSPQRFVLEQSLPIPSSGLDLQAGPSLRLGLPTTTEVITSTNAAN